MAGIKETKDVVNVGLQIGLAIKGALSDGKISLDDLAYLITIAPAIKDAVVGITLVPEELADLSVEESAEIVAMVAGQLGGGKTEEITVASLKAGLAIVNLILVILDKKA